MEPNRCCCGQPSGQQTSPPPAAQPCCPTKPAQAAAPPSDDWGVPPSSFTENGTVAARPGDDHAAWIVGLLITPAGDVPCVSTTLGFADRLGACKARWGIGRMSYSVTPGLYAVGRPTPESPVLVSANYKMSFDRLRAELGGMDAWILVLDTKGINVWCAAGKGSFGTDELVARIETTRLPEVVSHRTLIVPQLGAPGVAAHEVRKQSGFRVVYGPIRAADLPAFLAADMKAAPEMRQVEFPLRDRVALIPIELVTGAKYVLWVAAFCEL